MLPCVKCFRVALLALCHLALFAIRSRGSVIEITTADDYRKIESAKAGDEVIVAPGTYRFRLFLTAKAPASNPIRIHAKDPANKPVWDFSSTLVENAPGSYTAGDRGRGGWQFSGASGYEISGIVITGCHTSSANSAAIRYYSGSTNLWIRDCVFRGNDNGVTGGSQESSAQFEFCEFDSNGSPGASSPTHNMYIYGGTFVLRYCYVHDSVQAQNFHIRARNAVLEYNWFARAASYEGDLMPDGDFSGVGPFSQSMLLRGNVFIQNANPGNHSQVIAIYNDTALGNLTLAIQAYHNTFVGNGIAGNGASAAFVHLSNADGTAMSADLSNNIIYNTTVPVLVEKPASAAVSGRNNWLKTGTTSAYLQNSVTSASPGFANPSAADYTLAAGSACRGSAVSLPAGVAPSREYYKNETVVRQFRVRPAALDLGAFEHTSASAAYGPYDPWPLPSLGFSKSGNALTFSWPGTAAGFVLQSATNVSGPWTDAGQPYSLGPAGLSTQLSVSGPAAFFRLYQVR